MRAFKFVGVVVLMMAFVLMTFSTTLMAQDKDKTEKKNCAIKCDSKAKCTPSGDKSCAKATKCCPTEKSKCCPGATAKCSGKTDVKKCTEAEKSKCCPKSTDKAKTIKVEQKKKDTSI
jgi:hypothetical protein